MAVQLCMEWILIKKKLREQQNLNLDFMNFIMVLSNVSKNVINVIKILCVVLGLRQRVYVKGG